MAKGFKCGSGKDFPMELLWENARPTSSFSEQTISIDFSKFTDVAVDFAITTEYKNYSRVFAKVGDNGFFVGIRPYTSTYAQFCVRIFTYPATGIKFNAAYKTIGTQAGRTEDNTFCIPVRIYGIKGVTT